MLCAPAATEQSDLCWVKLEFGWKLYRMGQLLLICTLYWILIWVSSISHAAGLTCWKVDSWLSEKLLGRSRPTLVLQQATTGQGVCRNNASMEVLCYVEIKVIISVLEKGGCKRSIVNCMRQWEFGSRTKALVLQQLVMSRYFGLFQFKKKKQATMCFSDN